MRPQRIDTDGDASIDLRGERGTTERTS